MVEFGDYKYFSLVNNIKQYFRGFYIFNSHSSPVNYYYSSFHKQKKTQYNISRMFFQVFTSSR